MKTSGAFTAGLIASVAAGTLAISGLVLTGVAQGATEPVEHFNDGFDGTGALVSPWQNPGAFTQDSSSAYSQAGNGMAWRDTTTIDHEIEIPAYKLDGGGGPN